MWVENYSHYNLKSHFFQICEALLTQAWNANFFAWLLASMHRALCKLTAIFHTSRPTFWDALKPKSKWTRHPYCN